METLASPEYFWVWALLLTGALFYPVRQLIWVMQVRRAERDDNQDEERRTALKKRATVTSILLCSLFSFFYSHHLFTSIP
ncbi:MAG: hypothetical protein GKS01_14475 [Alphaproteobacteria bacterium]|nr:hypothetical protein [Alphaproteobacteria bacterium]